MAPVPATTMTGAVEGLVQRQNQPVVDGVVVSIACNGDLTVSVGGAVMGERRAVVDQEFSVGQPVMVARTDQDKWVVIGSGTTRAVSGTPGPSPTPPPIASATLHQAVLRQVNRQNQVLREGTVVGILDEGTLVVQQQSQAVLARAATTAYFSVGDVVYSIQQDDGSWLVLGSTGGTTVLEKPRARAVVLTVSAPSVAWAELATVTIRVSDAQGITQPTGFIRLTVDALAPMTEPLAGGTAEFRLAGLEASLFSPDASPPAMLESVTHALQVEFLPADDTWAATNAPGTLVVTDSIYAQLLTQTWTYVKLFEAADVPLPDCPTCVDLSLRGTIYSPAVTRFNGKWVMLFGGAVICRPPPPGWEASGGFFGRDSIALCDSDDGLVWTFRKWILEPDPLMCAVPRADLPSGIDAQVLDPHIWVEDGDPSTLHVIYTNASWEPAIFFDDVGQTCGHIGYATIDTSYTATVVNRRLLDGLAVTDGRGNLGYSRPTMQWVTATEKRIWVDTFRNGVGYLVSAPWVDPQPNIRDEGQAIGLDIDAPKLSYNDGLLLLCNSNPHGGIRATIRGADRVVRGPYEITQPSGNVWDAQSQGSPFLYLDPATCLPYLYYGGFTLTGAVIAVAVGDTPLIMPLC